MTTALVASLEKAGLNKRANTLNIAIAKYQNNGGTYEEARAILDAAYRQEGEAIRRVPKGHTATADPSDQTQSAGQHGSAEEAIDRLPAAPDHHAKVREHFRRKPGHARRGASAIAGVQETVSKSLFDTIKLPDGRKLREIKWSEVPDLSRRYVFLSRVMTLCHRKGTPPEAHWTLDRIVNEDDLKEIVEATERLNDAGI